MLNMSYRYFSMAFLYFLLFSLNCYAIQNATNNKPKLSYKETGRPTLPVNGPSVEVKLIPEGFPKNTPLILTMTNLLGKETTLPDKFFINEKNEIAALDKDRLPHEFNLSLFAKGEPIIYTLLTEDRKLKASVEIIPFPIEIEDKEGHRLSLKLLTADGQRFEMEASGFKPDELVTICSNSEGEKITYSVNASQEGTLIAAITPAVIGILTGKAIVELKGKTTHNLKLAYNWGYRALDYKHYQPHKKIKKWVKKETSNQ
jgi:hypothetical protein